MNPLNPLPEIPETLTMYDNIWIREDAARELVKAERKRIAELLMRMHRYANDMHDHFLYAAWFVRGLE